MPKLSSGVFKYKSQQDKGEGHVCGLHSEPHSALQENLFSSWLPKNIFLIDFSLYQQKAGGWGLSSQDTNLSLSYS